jgi:hypothetical protein
VSQEEDSNHLTMEATERLSLLNIGSEKAGEQASLSHTVEEASQVAGGRMEGWGSPLSRAGQEMGGAKWQHSYRYPILYPYNVGMLGDSQCRSRSCPRSDPPASSDTVESKGRQIKQTEKIKNIPLYPYSVCDTVCL